VRDRVRPHGGVVGLRHRNSWTFGVLGLMRRPFLTHQLRLQSVTNHSGGCFILSSGGCAHDRYSPSSRWAMSFAIPDGFAEAIIRKLETRRVDKKLMSGCRLLPQVEGPASRPRVALTYGRP